MPTKKTAPDKRGTPSSFLKLKITRDLVLFTGGLLGVIHETLLTDGERQSLLILFAGMMGLPVFLRKDEEKK